MGDLLDDRDEPLGEEYIYRPQNSLTLSTNASLGKRIDRRVKELHSEKAVSPKLWEDVSIRIGRSCTGHSR